MERKGLIHPGMCVAVMGLGKTGQAALRYCLGCGAVVLVSDSRDPGRFREEAGDILAAMGVEWEAGGHSFDFLRRADLVIVSPGIAHDHPVILQLAAAGIQVTGELAVAAPLIDVPVVAVTGTNGKTTVTSLIGEILKTAGKKVFIGGNIGTPLLEYLCSEMDADVLVLEVSSFQLQLAGDFTPEVGVLLNITPDHLDRHGSVEEYAAAKMCLFRHQNNDQTAIINGDDRLCMAEADAFKSIVRTFGGGPANSAQVDGCRVLVNDGCARLVFDLTGTPLGDSIGAGNAAAAILAARALRVNPAVIRDALYAFRKPPHRLEPVGSHAGVTYVDDSKATNTGAVIAALQQVENKAVLIAGGRDKGEDYRLLKDSVCDKARCVILIGEAAAKIEIALKGCTDLKSAATMEDAVRLAGELAQPGDTVLLSPACASFDMFRSYSHRGEVFTAAVRGMIAEHQGSAGRCG